MKSNWINDILEEAAREVLNWPEWARRPEARTSIAGCMSAEDGRVWGAEDGGANPPTPTIVCPKCGKIVEKLTKGRPHQCYECKRAYDRQYYQKTKEKQSVRRKKTRKKARNRTHRLIKSYLLSHPCEICGESDPVVLEFDHLDPAQKSHNIADMTRNNFSAEKILKEIVKCRVLCANCHRRETAKEQGWYED